MRTLYADNLRGCYVDLYDHFMSERQASQVFIHALSAPFKPERYNMRGNWIETKRQTVGYGDPGLVYRYSGVDRPAEPWPEYVLPVKSDIEQVLSDLIHRPVAYNYMLSTMYRDGTAGIGFHSDNEEEIRQDTPVCALSFGAGRDFIMRDAHTRERVLKVSLGAGSLLVMRGACQRYLQHALPERAGLRGCTRVSWTFRAITPAPGELSPSLSSS